MLESASGGVSAWSRGDGVSLVPGGRGVVSPWSWGCLPGPGGGLPGPGGMVSAWSRGVCLVPGGMVSPWSRGGVCLVPGGCLSGPRGVSLVPGGVGMVSQHALRQTPSPPVDRHTPVKTLPWPQLRCGRLLQGMCGLKCWNRSAYIPRIIGFGITYIRPWNEWSCQKY